MRRYRGFDRISRAVIVAALTARDGFACWICDGAFDESIVEPSHPALLTIDHAVAIGDGGEIGGPTQLENLRLAHALCNERRVHFAGRTRTWFAAELQRALDRRRLT